MSDETDPKIVGVWEDRVPERVSEYRSPSPLLLHEALRASGEEELGRTSPSLFWSGLAGGLSMGLSMVAAGLLHAHLPATPWRIIFTSLGFSLGFIIVIVGRQGLITENILSGVLPVLTRPSAARFRQLFRLWGSVLVGNLLGAVLFAFVSARTELFSPEVRQAFVELGRQKLEASFGTQLLRAVLAGWIIALALWTSTAAGTARVLIIPLLLWVVGMAHFGHIISGSVEVLSASLSGEVAFSEYLGRFFVPVLLGNLLGGVVLVAMLNHAQIFHEQRRLLAPRAEPEAASWSTGALPEELA